MNELVKTPENKSLLKPSPKSPSRSSRKKSAAENKYVEGVINLQLIKQDLHVIMIGPKYGIFLFEWFAKPTLGLSLLNAGLRNPINSNADSVLQFLDGCRFERIRRFNPHGNSITLEDAIVI